MTYEETLEELKFAIEHDIDFSKHNVDKILDKEDVERIVKELGVRARYRAGFLNNERAYYTLYFDTGSCSRDIATYFGKPIVNISDNYVINIDEDSDGQQ